MNVHTLHLKKELTTVLLFIERSSESVEGSSGKQIAP